MKPNHAPWMKLNQHGVVERQPSVKLVFILTSFSGKTRKQLTYSVKFIYNL